MENLSKFGITLICFSLALLVSELLSRRKDFSILLEKQGRYGAIDGLRGFLALSVFFYHFIITWYWKKNGSWETPPENYYINYGSVSVAIFFMITGFLFTFKILKDGSKINWLKLYESRIFRIFPLYIFVLLIISLIVFYSTHFELKVSTYSLVKEYIEWVIFYEVDIDNFPNTRLIIAGVVWTIKYEWLFYLSLPILSLIIKFKPIGILFILTLTILLKLKSFTFYSINTSYFILFAIGGSIAQICQYYQPRKSFIKSKIISSLTLAFMIFVVFYPKTQTMNLIHITLISLIFLSIVFGNDLFGVLSLKSSLLLGEISYSIYLIHGIVLYFSFSILDVPIQNYNIYQYLIFMPLLSIVVTLISAFTFLMIEKPSIEFGRKYLLSNMLNFHAK